MNTFAATADISTADFDHLSACRFSRLRDLAFDAGRQAGPLSAVIDALDGGRWSTGPAGIRASAATEAACRKAYRQAQLERAREAVAAQYAADPDRGDVADFYGRARLAMALIEEAARATHASDGPVSSLIEPDDIVEIVAAFVPIDDREDALFETEQAINDYHIGWREPTTEEDVEVAAELAQIETHLARIAAAPDSFDPASRPPLRPSHNASEAARVARRAEQSVALFQRLARTVPPHLRHYVEAEADLEMQRTITAERIAGLDLTDPKSWLNPPAKMFGTLRAVDFDPSTESRPPSWLIKGIAPRSGLGLIFGESGAGKTFLALHAALSVAWGLPFFGKRTKQGGVLYVAAEGGSSVLPRIRAANEALQGAIAAANLARRAGTPSLTRAPLRVVTEAPNLSRDGDPGPLIRTIQQAEADFAAAGHRLALVVVDTWHAAMGGGDENSAADAGAALAPLREVAEAHGALVLIVHHPGKDVERGARGSNALPAAADAIIALSVPGHGGAMAKPAHAIRKATVTKLRDGDVGGEFSYRLPTVQLGLDEEGDPWTTCVVESVAVPKADDEALTATDRELMDAVRAGLSEAEGDRVSVREMRLRFYAGRPEAKPDARRVAFGRALSAAIKAGRIMVDDSEEWAWLQ